MAKINVSTTVCY